MHDEQLEVSFDRDTFVLTLDFGDEPSTLYLTVDEAQSLASEIRSRLLTAQSDPIVVCDVPIAGSNAWNVIITVEEALARDDPGNFEFPADHDPHRANWLIEGF